LFKIGAVARLTGVSVHTLRKWEDRHSAVRPRRSKGGKRLYTDADIQRLVLIKRLLEHGMSLHSIAGCSFEELADRWSRLTQAEAAPPVSGPVRVAVHGSGIGAWLKAQHGHLAEVELIAAADDAKELKRRIGASDIDVLAIECPAVTRTTSGEVQKLMQELDAPAAVVVYWFGNEQHIETLQSSQTEVLRAPLDAIELRRAIARMQSRHGAPLQQPADGAAQLAADPPPPRLSRESLGRMSVAHPRASCGCQKNLVDVALSLRALEDYLNGCESRSVEDEALHRTLWRKVGVARSSIEEAIEHFAAVEGIEL
jgi:DNA-binding transcriptional MerR regulator